VERAREGPPRDHRIGELKKSKRKRAREGLSLVCAARESLPLRVVETLLGWDEGKEALA
jgi:hypothetical protein